MRWLTGSAELPRFQFAVNWPIALTVRHPIPLLALICGPRTSPRAETIGKRLLAKQMTYTESIDVYPA